MCGRYQIDEDMQEIIERFDIDSIFRDAETRIGEVFPGSRAPAVIISRGKRILKSMKWGIRPVFMDKDIINTRRESLFTKKMYHAAIMQSRCIIPAGYFYEWEKVGDRKIKRRIYDESRKILAFAGIYDESARYDGESGTQAFSIITMEASAGLRQIHDRMPAVISIEDERDWLTAGLTAENITAILDRALPVLKTA